MSGSSSAACLGVISLHVRSDWTGALETPQTETHMPFVWDGSWGVNDYDEQLQIDAQFLCSHQRMDTDLVDRLVLQLNRIHPQILSDKEACKFRNLNVPTEMRLPELLTHLQEKGDDACYEFYRALHIHAEDIYSRLPSRVRQREMNDSKCVKSVAVIQERSTLNDRGSVFFLSCFSFAAGIATLYYYREGEPLRCTGSFLHFSAKRLGTDAKDVLISYAEAGKQK